MESVNSIRLDFHKLVYWKAITNCDYSTNLAHPFAHIPLQVGLRLLDYKFGKFGFLLMGYHFYNLCQIWQLSRVNYLGRTDDNYLVRL
jgi:hypothetical protein